MDCVRLGSVNKFAWTKVMLCDLKSMKNRCYTEVTRASENWLLIFDTSFTKNQEFGNQTFDWVRLSISFVWVRFRSIAELNRTQSMDWVSSIEIQFDWVRLTMPGIQAINSKRKYEKLAVVRVHVLQNTQNLAISRCCFEEDGYKMNKDL